MVRKPVFTRDEIVAASLQVVRQDGLEMLSARRVAEELGSSTAPVYSNFRNMEDLECEVKSTMVDLLLYYARQHVTEDAFLDMGYGVLRFARQEPRLYAALFLGPVTGCDPGSKVMERLLEDMAEIPKLAELTPVERIIVLNKMAIFTHGLAVELCQGRTDDLHEKVLYKLMAETGEAIVADASTRPERSPDDVALFASLCQKSTGCAGDESDV